MCHQFRLSIILGSICLSCIFSAFRSKAGFWLLMVGFLLLTFVIDFSLSAHQKPESLLKTCFFQLLLYFLTSQPFILNNQALRFACKSYLLNFMFLHNIWCTLYYSYCQYTYRFHMKPFYILLDLKCSFFSESNTVALQIVPNCK